mmetsp:Transcript_33724/g.80046  ORF Transcript_33724/g.80046 Transcript_33724/m.80046 type:complete len:227 (+) Transcript_33724:77-757(+)
MISNDVDFPELLLTEILRLRPTQLAVGMQQVNCKANKIKKKCAACQWKKLDRFLKNKPLPIVKGPRGVLYIVDHHHLCCALHQLGVTQAYVKVIKDWSAKGENDFWQDMQRGGYLWLHGPAGEPLSVGEMLRRLPRDITGLDDDPYRSLAALVRKAGGYCKDWTPFSEFRWANYFRELLPEASQDPARPETIACAVKLAAEPSALGLPGHLLGTKSDLCSQAIRYS